MSYGYVLTEECGGGGRLGFDKIQTFEPITGDPEELRAGLRAWTLATTAREGLGDGRYTGYLVELEDDGTFDTYLALCFEVIIWFYEQEYVPAT